MSKILSWISDHLLILVLIVVAFSLLFPQLGSFLNVLSIPLLALMVLCVSLTINVDSLKDIKKNPFIIIWCAFLQFVPVLLFSFVLGKILFKGNLTTGQILLGSLPADISATLMVCLVGGSTALATAMLVVQMALTPVVLPFAVTLLSGESFKMPVSYLIIELALVIIIPVVLGIMINHLSKKVRTNRDVFLGSSSICYLGLLLIVVSINAQSIISLKAFALVFVAAELMLNLFGYLVALITKLIFRRNEHFYTMLFLTSSKEFGISSAAAATMGLSPVVNVPSAFFAVIQMISMPVVVKIINHFRQTGNPAKSKRSASNDA